MADFTITITNRLTCLGGARTQTWGSGGQFPMVWGTSLWGDVAMITRVDKFVTITNSLTLDSGNASLNANKLISNSLAMTSDCVDMTVRDADGYYRTFTKPTLDSDERNNSDWSAGSDASGSYSTVSKPSTTWS